MQKILIIFCAMFIGTAYACESNEIDVLGNGTQCETAKFTITTINLNANRTFAFYMSAKGDFYVDWGDGTVDTITRDNTTETLYDHTYTTAGVKTIRFGGLATGYGNVASINTRIDSAIRFGYTDFNGSGSGYVPSTGSTPELISAIDGSLGAIFPRLESASTKAPRFAWVLAGTNIETIPENLFYGARGYPSYMFGFAFMNCALLKSIPENLFSDVTGSGADMFRYTFYGCTSLTSLPPNLFSNIKTGASYLFMGTFSGCTSLSGYVPPSMFSGLIANGSPYNTSNAGMMYVLFDRTNLRSTCPAGTVQYMTGYESRWGGRVSCVDENLVCGAGEYLPAHWYQCEQCPENNYCPGGTYTYNGNSQGATQCPTGLFAPNGMWEAAQCGRILHVGDGFVYLRATKKTSPSLHLDLDHDGVADYFGNMTTLDVPMSRNTQRKLKVRYNNTTYSIYDDSVELPTE